MPRRPDLLRLEPDDVTMRCGSRAKLGTFGPARKAPGPGGQNGRYTCGLRLYNQRWPILSLVASQPPAKFAHDDGDRVGRAVNSLVSNGVIVSGGLVRNSVLSPGARVDNWSRVDRAVILNNSRVGRHAVVENTILDKNVIVQEGSHCPHLSPHAP
jgi:ADP-glucose pyrophosphorylase